MSESKLFEKTVCLGVVFHRPGCHRQERRTKSGEVEVRLSGASPETKADQSQLTVTKRIFKHPAYKAAANVDYKLDQWIRKNSLPDPILRKGAHLIPVAILDEVYDRLREAEVEYNTRADELIAAYEDAKEEAKKRLKELYREEDYPTAERLRRAFWVERNLFEYTPAGASKLSEQVYEAEKAKWLKTMSEAEDEVRQTLRQICLDLVSHLSDILTPTADGKKKRIYQSTIDKMTEFFELFDQRNVLDDEELKKLIEKAKGFVRGDEGYVDALKSSDEVRDMVRKGMETVKEKLVPLVEEGPRRVISFEED